MSHIHPTDSFINSNSSHSSLSLSLFLSILCTVPTIIQSSTTDSRSSFNTEQQQQQQQLACLPTCLSVYLPGFPAPCNERGGQRRYDADNNTDTDNEDAARCPILHPQIRFFFFFFSLVWHAPSSVNSNNNNTTTTTAAIAISNNGITPNALSFSTLSDGYGDGYGYSNTPTPTTRLYRAFLDE